MKRVIFFILVICMLLCGCTAPSPDVTDAATPTPTVDVTPMPTVDVTPTPTVEPTSAPTPSFTLSPLVPVTTSTPTPTQKPTLMPTATPTQKPTPTPTATPTPKPTPTPTATPTPKPTPTPTATPTQKPTPTPTPLINAVEVEYAPNVVTPGKTYTGKVPLEPIKFVVNDPKNTRQLSTYSYGFSFGVAKNEKPHNTTINNQNRFDGWGTNALAWDNKTAQSEKVLYLTFDCGYKYEDLCVKILDTLKDKEVPAAFFCTLQYVKQAPEEVVRMINEGHIVGNHSTNHPSDCSKLTREAFAKEILGLHNYLRVNFAYDCRYFRFPTGAHSQDATELVNSVGYRTAFWSIAYADWDPKNQKGEDVALETITSRLHPGAVILLHSTSPDNAEILGTFIDYARAHGYEFRSLDDYPGWK